MSYSACKVSVDESGIATLTMARPEIHNAFDDKVIAELRRILSELAARDDLRLLVLAAEGKSFSAGADASWMRRMAGYSHQENRHDARELAGLMKQLDRFPAPTLARVQGAAFGGGVGLVACCDFSIASERASFCLSEVKIGLIPATISPYVIAAIGARAARRYAISAERFSAAEAQQLGLVTQCVTDEQLDASVSAFCQNLLNNSPAAMAAAKTLIRDYQSRDIDDELIEDSCTRIADIRVSPEGQEGLSAFLDKRQASWIRKQNNV